MILAVPLCLCGESRMKNSRVPTDATVRQARGFPFPLDGGKTLGGGRRAALTRLDAARDLSRDG